MSLITVLEQFISHPFSNDLINLKNEDIREALILELSKDKTQSVNYNLCASETHVVILKG